MRNCWLIKSSSMVLNEMRARQPTKTNVPQKWFHPLIPCSIDNYQKVYFQSEFCQIESTIFCLWCFKVCWPEISFQRNFMKMKKRKKSSAQLFSQFLKFFSFLLLQTFLWEIEFILDVTQKSTHIHSHWCTQRGRGKTGTLGKI